MYQTSVKTSEKMSTHDEISDDDAMAGSDDALAVSDDALASSDDALAGRDDATAGCDDHAGHDNEMADADDVSRGIFLNNDGESEDAITMVISPDLPYHLLDPSQEDIDEYEEEDGLVEGEERGEDGKVYTDSLSEMCLCVCKICSTKMKFNSLREHVRIQHSLRMSQYKQQYGKIAYSRMTYHRCKGCGKVLRAIYATIKKHLQTVHSQSFKEYATQYNIFKGRFDKKEDICMENKMFSDDPTQMCMTVCKVCNTNLEPYNMKNHVKGKHFLSMIEYKTNFGDVEFISEVFHSCKVCDKSVLFEYQKLSNHLFFNHGIGIAKYKDFLQGKMSLEDLQQTEPTSPKSKDDQAKHRDEIKKKKQRTKPKYEPQRPQSSAAAGFRSPFLNQQNLSLALMQSLQQSPMMLQNALLMQQMALMGPELMQQMSMMGPEFMQQMAMMSPELMQTMALMGPDAFNALLLGGTNNSPNNGIEVSLMRNNQSLSSLLKNNSILRKEPEAILKQTPVQDQ